MDYGLGEVVARRVVLVCLLRVAACMAGYSSEMVAGRAVGGGLDEWS